MLICYVNEAGKHNVTQKLASTYISIAFFKFGSSIGNLVLWRRVSGVLLMESVTIHLMGVNINRFDVNGYFFE